MTLWVDLVARARGLRTHRLGPGTLAALRRAPDLAAFGHLLADAGFPVADGERRPPALDLAVRRRAAAELNTLARWSGSRSDALAVIFEEEDRRSLRAILRGALQHQRAELRLGGLVPTPGLPERALATLAALPAPRDIATLLVVWRHPFADALREPAGAALPDPLALDLALDRAWASRAAAGARRGGPEVRRFVEDTIDLANAATVLTLAGAASARTPERYLEGGRRLTRVAFTALVARSRSTVGEALGDLFPASPYGDLLRRGRTAGLDDALLAARVEVQHRATRHAPLGPAPVLWCGLELRAETTALSRMIWALALGMPAEATAATPVTA